jgi:hypothetical protein
MQQLAAAVQQLTSVVQQLTQQVQQLTASLPPAATPPTVLPQAASAAPQPAGAPDAAPPNRQSSRVPQVNIERADDETLVKPHGNQASNVPVPRRPQTIEQWNSRLEAFLDAQHEPADHQPESSSPLAENPLQLQCNIAAALARGSHRFRELNVDVQAGGRVTLTGSVPSEHLLHIAAFVVSRVPGVREVINRLQVVTEAPIATNRALQYWRDKGTLAKAGHIAAAVIVLVAAYGFANYDRFTRPRVYPVAGIVKFEGAAADGAKLVFHPLGKTAASAGKNAVPAAITARTRSDGSFAPTTFDPHDGAPAGEYRVTIEWRKLVGSGEDLAIGPNVLPPQYADPDASPLKVTIAQGENRIPPFELVR